MAIALGQLGTHGRSIVLTRAKPMAQHPVVSRVSVIVKEHAPVIPRKLGNGADVKGRTLKLGLRGFHVEVINLKGSIGADQCGQFKAVIPETLWA